MDNSALVNKAILDLELELEDAGVANPLSVATRIDTLILARIIEFVEKLEKEIEEEE